MRVVVALALPGRQAAVELDLAEGATVAEALAAARLEARFPDVDARGLEPGIWSKTCTWDAALREGDRVELYRPLEADAKQMRRERAKS